MNCEPNKQFALAVNSRLEAQHPVAAYKKFSNETAF